MLRDLRHQKKLEPGLLRGIACVILRVVVMVHYAELTLPWFDGGCG